MTKPPVLRSALISSIPQAPVRLDGEQTYLYGIDRRAAVGTSGRVWHLHDALDSVRQTLNEAGALPHAGLERW